MSNVGVVEDVMVKDKLVFAAKLADALTAVNESMRANNSVSYFEAKASVAELGVKLPRGSFIRRCGVSPQLIEALREADTIEQVDDVIQVIGYDSLF